ncbi:MAG TPA: LptA/OstA family protein [Alphaproteobacteria bacterium]|nr:hypothetical protein [Rhodospirillaceae bacterium]HRJ11707.1 LptA/OstA family protein [Alphaproteobacteria bacterium]
MRKIILTLLLLLPINTVFAAEPIEIEAAGSLIWQQSDKTYRAVGDATAVRGKLQIRADELIAHYIDTNGKNEIQLLEAKGNVQMNNDGNLASGPYGSYDANSGNVILRGADLKLIATNGDTLTAQQEIQFNDKTGKSSATGAPFLARADRTLAAEKIDAQFIRDANGGWVLQNATANQNVIITTGIGTAEPSIASGSQGFYDAGRGSALLTGDVRIKKGQNQLNGQRAEIDLNSGIAKLLPDIGGGKPGRVKALLYQK